LGLIKLVPVVNCYLELIELVPVVNCYLELKKLVQVVNQRLHRMYNYGVFYLFVGPNLFKLFSLFLPVADV